MSNHQRRPWDLGARGVQVLAAFAVLVAIIAAVLAWQSRPAVTTVPVDSGPLPPVATISDTAVALVVAVSGRVRRPGLVRLPPGARVADALDAAGGVLPGTDTSSLNLARRVADGELIAVGVPGVGGPGVVATPGGAAGGPVNLNTATLEQLQTLPGVGPVLAQRILDYRTAHGGFRTIGDLRNVSGIGEARFNDLKARVSV